ncbi:hypothetical protein JOQ06_011052, partial [Pogonophryne albipinna]
LFEHLARIVSGGCEPQTRSLKAVSLTGDQATSVCVRAANKDTNESLDFINQSSHAVGWQSGLSAQPGPGAQRPAEEPIQQSGTDHTKVTQIGKTSKVLVGKG